MVTIFQRYVPYEESLRHDTIMQKSMIIADDTMAIFRYRTLMDHAKGGPAISLMVEYSVTQPLEHSPDSVAAQATGNALAEIWEILGVDNQTDAMEKLRNVPNEQTAFEAGFYVGAAQERKDGTPNPFFPADQCYRKWIAVGRKWEGKYP
jgi:hypothetical protein